MPSEPCGVLPDFRLKEAIAKGWITADGPIRDDQVQPGSLDLTLGDRAYRMQYSFLPGRRTVEATIDQTAIDEISLAGAGGVLEQNRPYLIPLRERLCLPAGMRAQTNPKSSTGRLDVFCRTVADGTGQFDSVNEGRSTQLYLEVVSNSFTVRVTEGLSLNQLRLVMGSGSADVSNEELARSHAADPLLFLDGVPVEAAVSAPVKGFVMSLDLRPRSGSIVGYRAKRNSQLLDLSRVGAYEVEDYWHPIYCERAGNVILEPEEFCLLLSAESVSVPPKWAAEMAAYETASGELRSHYAGFFDPGFGYDNDLVLRDARATLEVRARNVPFMVEHGQAICRLGFTRMLEPPERLYGEAIGSHYQAQQVTLSKHFRFDRPRRPGQLSLSNPSLG